MAGETIVAHPALQSTETDETQLKEPLRAPIAPIPREQTSTPKQQTRRY
jgi:hypothetical protein